MAVLLHSGSRVVAVGATGPYGRAQVRFMAGAGTKVVAQVSPGRGGEIIDDLPAFDTVAEAVAATACDTAMIYTPAFGAREALMECADAGLGLAVAAAEFVPLQDSLYAAAYARERGLWAVGPNTVGMISPGQALLGALSPDFTRPGRIGVIGRSGTLSIACTDMLTRAGLGQSTVVHIGGDAICGRNPHEWLELFLNDPDTAGIIYLGEIGGGKEYAMLDSLSTAVKPVIAMIVGRCAPAGKRMGHAGALIGGERETAAAKAAALADAGALIARTPATLVGLAKELVD